MQLHGDPYRISQIRTLGSKFQLRNPAEPQAKSGRRAQGRYCCRCGIGTFDTTIDFPSKFLARLFSDRAQAGFFFFVGSIEECDLPVTCQVVNPRVPPLPVWVTARFGSIFWNVNGLVLNFSTWVQGRRDL